MMAVLWFGLGVIVLLGICVIVIALANKRNAQDADRWMP